jgi:hypothetical protein
MSTAAKDSYRFLLDTLQRYISNQESNYNLNVQQFVSIDLFELTFVRLFGRAYETVYHMLISYFQLISISSPSDS